MNALELILSKSREGRSPCEQMIADRFNMTRYSPDKTIREAEARKAGDAAEDLAKLAEYEKLSNVIMCAYCGHESPKGDKMAIINHTMQCENRPEVKLLEKAFEIEDRLYQRIIHLTKDGYRPESCDVCKEISELLRIYHETD